MECKPLIESAVQIRPFHPEDSHSLHAAACESNVALCATMTWFQPDYSLKDAARFIERSAKDWCTGERYDFVVVDTLDETFCGSVSLNHIDRRHRFANVGFWVRRSRLGQGIATNAVRLAADFAFRRLALLRLEFLVAQSNQASQRVVAKTGAKPEGALRKRLTLAGAPEDALIFSLLYEDWVQSGGV